MKEDKRMNIQQLRYVVAIANSGTFREAAEKMYVSQPSLSIAVRDLEKELGFKIFHRTSSGTFLTRRGMEFYEKAQELVKGFDIFQNHYTNLVEEKAEFSIASQHYDFLPPLITEFARCYPKDKNFRIFESTTVQILDEVAQGHSEIGIIYLNNPHKVPSTKQYPISVDDEVLIDSYSFTEFKNSFSLPPFSSLPPGVKKVILEADGYHDGRTYNVTQNADRAKSTLSTGDFDGDGVKDYAVILDDNEGQVSRLDMNSSSFIKAPRDGVLISNEVGGLVVIYDTNAQKYKTYEQQPIATADSDYVEE